MEPNEKIHRPLKQMLFHNFLGGIAWGLGASVGLALVITVITFVIRQAGGLPLGAWFANIVESSVQELESRNTSPSK